MGPSPSSSPRRKAAVTHRVDTHHHVVPPVYAEWLAARGIDAGGRAIPDWTVDKALVVMDRLEVSNAVLSVSTPGVHLGDDDEARQMARAVNEFAADVARTLPDRFGFFATLTLPDVEGALDELVSIGNDGPLPRSPDRPTDWTTRRRHRSITAERTPCCPDEAAVPMKLLSG